MTKRFKHTVVGSYKALMPAIQKISLLISEYQPTGPTMQAVFDIDDTLIFDDERQTPNIQVKHLLEVARAHGCKIHLVTARERSPEVTKWTRDELRRQGIQFDSLALAPAKCRETMATVAAWKHSERARNAPVVVSVGDQWGDLLLLADEADIDLLNARHKTHDTPWVIVQPNDAVTVYGVKLMAPL
jgi:hypothetical protein